MSSSSNFNTKGNGYSGRIKHYIIPKYDQTHLKKSRTVRKNNTKSNITYIFNTFNIIHYLNRMFVDKQLIAKLCLLVRKARDYIWRFNDYINLLNEIKPYQLNKKFRNTRGYIFNQILIINLAGCEKFNFKHTLASYGKNNLYVQNGIQLSVIKDNLLIN